MDPLKEINVHTLSLQHNISTLASVTAETGQDDYESILEQRAREMQMERDLGVVPRVVGVAAGASNANGGDAGEKAAAQAT